VGVILVYKSSIYLKIEYHLGLWGGVIVLILPVQSVPITTNVVSFSPVHGEVYSIIHYVIKFVSDI